MAKTFKTVLNQQTKVDSTMDILDLLNHENEENKTKSTSNNTILKSQTQLENESVRQTFVLGNSYMETLKDFIYTKKIKGDVLYNQKDALEESLGLLFKTIIIEKRPEKLKELENKRSQNIKRGKK